MSARSRPIAAVPGGGVALLTRARIVDEARLLVERDGYEQLSLRGLAAALASGLGFWAISGIWLGGSTRNPSYAVNFVSWFVAFAPGFACLLLEPAVAALGPEDGQAFLDQFLDVVGLELDPAVGVLDEPGAGGEEQPFVPRRLGEQALHGRGEPGGDRFTDYTTENRHMDVV